MRRFQPLWKAGTALATLVICIVCACAAPKGSQRSIVITENDERAIERILVDFKQHTDDVSRGSDVQPYLNCDAHRQLLACGVRALPYIVEQLAQQQAVRAYVGAVLIGHWTVRTPAEVFEYNQRRMQRVHQSTLPPFVLGIVFQELVSADNVPGRNTKNGAEQVTWVRWWRANKDRFIRSTGRLPRVLPHDEMPVTPQVRTTAHNGLLDILAVSATYQQMIERAAAEMGSDVFIGEQEYLDIMGTVEMRSVTLEEFLYIIGRTVSVNGFDYGKTDTGYRLGGLKPAKARAIMNGWGIMMDKTVFRSGDEMPVTVITRTPVVLIDPCDPAFPGWGSFRVITNDGKVVREYEPVTKPQPTLTTVTVEKDCQPATLRLDKFCCLPPGEYNIWFRYVDHETPSIAIEVYEGPVLRQ